MIAEIFQDPTTIIKGHTILTHLPCLLLRSGIAVSILTGVLPDIPLYILCIGVIIVFGGKYVSLPNVWKVYLRTIFVYAIVLLLTYFYGDKYRHVSATLVFVDVLMAIQSRHIFERLSFA